MNYESPQNMPVAVYGSLRFGGGNDGIWTDRPGVQSIGLGTVAGVSLRYHHTGFPYGMPEDGYKAVVEVITADSEAWPMLVARLDRLEGHPSFYTRTQRTVTMDNGLEFTAWTYLILDGYAADMERVPGNDWLNVNPWVVGA